MEKVEQDFEVVKKERELTKSEKVSILDHKIAAYKATDGRGVEFTDNEMKALYQLQHIRVPRCTSLRYLRAPLSTSHSGWRHIHPPLVTKNSVVCILIGCLAT